jgi:hypothetical protein
MRYRKAPISQQNSQVFGGVRPDEFFKMSYFRAVTSDGDGLDESSALFKPSDFKGPWGARSVRAFNSFAGHPLRPYTVDIQIIQQQQSALLQDRMHFVQYTGVSLGRFQVPE